MTDTDFLSRVASRLKHGPGEKGGPGACDPNCLKCEVDRRMATIKAALKVERESVIRVHIVSAYFDSVAAFATEVVTIGHAPSCHIAVRGDARRIHATLSRSGDAVWLMNLFPEGPIQLFHGSTDHSAKLGTVMHTHILKPGQWAKVGDTFISVVE